MQELPQGTSGSALWAAGTVLRGSVIQFILMPAACRCLWLCALSVLTDHEDKPCSLRYLIALCGYKTKPGLQWHRAAHVGCVLGDHHLSKLCHFMHPAQSVTLGTNDEGVDFERLVGWLNQRSASRHHPFVLNFYLTDE